MKVLDLFGGCGGFTLGFEQAGFDIIAVERNSKLFKTFMYNHRRAKLIRQDIFDVDPRQFRGINIVIGSPPCKAFTTANRFRNIEAGLKNIDIFLEFIEIIKPKFWIMENVPPLRRFLRKREIKDMIILNAADFGVPQVRKRLFTGTFPIPSPTHEENHITIRQVISDLIKLPVNQDAFQNHDCCKFDPNANYARFVGKWQGLKVLDLDKPFPTISCNHGNTNLIQVNNKLRKFSNRELARGQTFPDSFRFFGSVSDVCDMIGQAVPPLLAFLFAKMILNQMELGKIMRGRTK